MAPFEIVGRIEKRILEVDKVRQLDIEVDLRCLVSDIIGACTGVGAPPERGGYQRKTGSS
ncbi:MAG: hypothetical protein ACR2HJ_02370 [Fimbriimonadales bacterium]